MSDEMQALARRAVACKGFRPLAGMVDPHGGRVVADANGELVYAPAPCSEWDDPVCEPIGWGGPFLPNLADPATLGCLLALVREAWGPLAHASMSVGGWRIMDTWKQHPSTGRRATVGLGVWDQPTEAHALVAALEAAP